MGERKPACHYIPPDFDPNKPARRCKPQNGQHQVRFMLPMSIQCSNCGDYMFQGTKANCRKELCYKEFYKGINVYRIYMHCKACYAEITIKTDPEHGDYIVEKGATRHFEPWHELQLAQVQEMKQKIMGTLPEKIEDKTVNTQLEMEQRRELERLRAINNKQKTVDYENLMKIKQTSGVESTLTQEDLELVKKFEERKKNMGTKLSSNVFRPKSSIIPLKPPPKNQISLID